MNMLANRHGQSNRWDTHLCLEILKKIEQILDDSYFLRMGRSTKDTYEVIDDHNNAVNLQSRGCSYRRWEVHCLPCKYACAAIMQAYTNFHSYLNITSQSNCTVSQMATQHSPCLIVTSHLTTIVTSVFGRQYRRNDSAIQEGSELSHRPLMSVIYIIASVIKMDIIVGVVMQL